ncbi:hypothetical protein ACHAXT_003134 [Thalassiosira profunda]
MGTFDRWSTIAIAKLHRGAEDDVSSSSSGDKRHKIFLHTWVLLTAAFVVINAKVRPFPAFLLHSLSRQQWALVHAISSMLFSGTIILSALLEQIVVASRNAAVMRFWFLGVPKRLDASVVLPSLSLAMLSGVGQAAWDYGGLMHAPKHVTGAFHCLLAFGIWWMVTDVTTQKGAAEAVELFEGNAANGTDGKQAVEVPKVLQRRATSNVVSCIFVLGLYALMVLKPGFGA